MSLLVGYILGTVILGSAFGRSFAWQAETIGWFTLGWLVGMALWPFVFGVSHREVAPWRYFVRRR